MPRFYFNLFLGSHASIDEWGHEVNDLQAAATEAKRTAGELAREQLLSSQDDAPETIRVEVKDEHRQPVLTVTVSIRIDEAG